MKKCLSLSFVALLSVTLFGQTGTWPIKFHNGTKIYADSQIYVWFMVNAPANGHVDKNGVVQPYSTADVTGPGHYTRNGINYAPYAVRLSDMVNYRCPTITGGGRIYMSVGAPLCLNVTNNGCALPDPLNANDPNAGIYYDWFELTYGYNGTPFGGNSTQVDLFGFPYVAKVYQSSSHFLDSCGYSGISMPQVMKLFKDSMSAPFQASIQPTRILAPSMSRQFFPGGAYANYFQPYIDSLWADWTAKPFTIKYGGGTWILSSKSTDTLTVTGTNSGVLGKPTTQGIWGNGFGSINIINMVAPLSSAMCRGVARDTSWYNNPSTYYKKSNYRSEYAELLHKISIHNKAYGFGYDDNNNQSSVLILGNSQPLDSLVINFGSFEPSDGAVVPEQKPQANSPAIRLVRTNNIIVVQSASPIAKVTLVSLNGKAMRKSLQVDNNAFSMAGLSAGIYYVQITDKQGLATTQKICKE